MVVNAESSEPAADQYDLRTRFNEETAVFSPFSLAALPRRGSVDSQFSRESPAGLRTQVITEFSANGQDIRRFSSVVMTMVEEQTRRPKLVNCSAPTRLEDRKGNRYPRPRHPLSVGRQGPFPPSAGTYALTSNMQGYRWDDSERQTGFCLSRTGQPVCHRRDPSDPPGDRLQVPGSIRCAEEFYNAKFTGSHNRRTNLKFS